MRIRYRLLPLCLLSLLLSAQRPAQAPQPSDDSTALRVRIRQLAQRLPGRVGVAAKVIETGESVEWHGDEQFPMQSVYKMPIAMAVLHLVDRGTLTLEQIVAVRPNEYVSKQQRSPLRDEHPDGATVSVSDLLRYAVSESDGSASDVLMRLAGGPSATMAYLNGLAIRGISIVNTEKEIGSDQATQYRNWAKPTEAVALLTRLQAGKGLSAASRAHLLHLMTDTQTGLNRLKGQLPVGTIVAHKTGTSTTVDGLTAATNDIGLITLPNKHHLAIAVFVADAKADVTAREAVIAKIARAVWEVWK